jgi:ribonuclease BN (tRNA processing enzyme)
VTVRAIENTHYTLTPGSPEGNNKSLSFRFDMPDRSIVYTGDTGPSSSVETLARDADLLIAEMLDFSGTMVTVRNALAGQSEARVREISEHLVKHHLTPENIGEMAKRAGVRQVVVTHMGPGSLAVEDLLRYRSGVESHFSGPVTFASDLDSF